jgi:hypothetical protein
MGSWQAHQLFMYQYFQIRYCASLMITLRVSKHVVLETTFNIALNDIHTTSLVLTVLNRIAFSYIHNVMDTLKLKFWKLFSPAHGCASRLTNTLDIEMKILHSVCSLVKSLSSRFQILLMTRPRFSVHYYCTETKHRMVCDAKKCQNVGNVVLKLWSQK